MEFKDYYATLGIGRNAPADEVKAAFRKLARRYHPDVNPNDPSAERRFKEVNEAYEVLGNPETRRKYDELGANWKLYEQAPAAGGHPFAGSRPFAGGGSGAGGRVRTVSGDDLRDMLGGSAFSDFFQTFFGGADPVSAGSGRRAQAASRRGRNLEQAIELTLEQAFTGVTRRLVLAGAGGGRSVDVRIPAGVDNGSRVRVAGSGEPGSGGAQAGDLLLRVELLPHPRYTRKGLDLYLSLPIPLTTAVLGGEVTAPTIDGGTVRLKVPPTTQQGQVFRIKGQGMPSPRNGGARGDQYATAHVELPRHLTAAARRHFEALAAMERTDDARRANPRPRAKDPAE